MTVAGAIRDDHGDDCCRCTCTFRQATAEKFVASCKCANKRKCPSFKCSPKMPKVHESEYDYGPAALEQPGPLLGDQPAKPPPPGMIPLHGPFRGFGGDALPPPNNETAAVSNRSQPRSMDYDYGPAAASNESSVETGGSDSTTKPPGNSSRPIQIRAGDKGDVVTCKCHCVLRPARSRNTDSSADCDCLGDHMFCDSWTCDIDLRGT